MRQRFGITRGNHKKTSKSAHPKELDARTGPLRVSRHVWWCAICLALLAGCSRAHYRRDADAETSRALYFRTLAAPWKLPERFTIEPDPRSRLYDPSDPDRPYLPPASPRLYTYQLPLRAAGSETDSGVVPVSFQQPTPQTQRVVSLKAIPIPRSAWQSLPPECQALILEFSDVRKEYELTHDSQPPQDLRDLSQKLTLEDIIELGLLNSREYQTQKETLYRTALALTLEQFDYDLKFLETGNRTDVNYDHMRSAGKTVNQLGVPTNFRMNKLLATGGTLLASFANHVLLTFNGPDGFAADISSDLFFELTQTVFQRDILLEPLIQAERDVVYAARDFARFRKSFFFRRTSEYYSLLRNYRQIEIEAQNYFSLVRALNQAEAEERAGLQSRIQVEQIEQSMLQGRSRLITTCDNLQSRLDQLKIAMGLPTELPISLDLTELQRITLRDEIQVAAERVSRVRRRLGSQRHKQFPDRGELLNSAVSLIQRLMEWLRLRGRLVQEASKLGPLEQLDARLRVDQARLDVDRVRQELRKARESKPPAPPILLFQRTIDLTGILLELTTSQLRLADHLHADSESTAALKEKNKQFTDQADGLKKQLATALKNAQREQIPILQQDAERLLAKAEELVRSADRLTGATDKHPTPEERLQETLERSDALLKQCDQLLQAAEIGLIPVEMEVDDAMLTALSQRLDLMNRRGRLADDGRDVKFAADDLKSVLNLRAAETIRTKKNKNRPFGFTFDESTTELDLSLDLPLNRKAQRNGYRLALIDYQAALRSLMELEDNIKLDVREDLRDLALSRVQYLISVASAALAAERVLSTRLELALGFPGVAARDFLEAQDASRAALSAVADNHIGYLVKRTEFFVDLELMQLDPSGFWPQLYDEQFQPAPHPQLSPEAGPAYGELPEFLHISREIRQMLSNGNWCPSQD